MRSCAILIFAALVFAYTITFAQNQSASMPMKSTPSPEIKKLGVFIGSGGDGRFDLGPDGRGLSVEIVEPRDARTGIEDNSVMAPGQPGSVDKGELQERGQRLTISTSEPRSSAVFDLRLAIQ